MREILFRGRRKNDGKWCYGDFIRCGVRMYIRDRVEYYYTEVEPKTVGQFTGLTDKNGTKIFEGDIIRRKRIDGNWYNYEVFWWENCWGIKGGAEVALLILPLCGLQVIGNIYDNPELIKEDIRAARRAERGER